MFQDYFFTNLDYDRATSKKTGKTLLDVPNAVDCQNKCYKTEGCEHFIFVEPHLQCHVDCLKNWVSQNTKEIGLLFLDQKNVDGTKEQDVLLLSDLFI